MNALIILCGSRTSASVHYMLHIKFVRRVASYRALITRVPYTRSLIKLLSVFVVVERCYFSITSVVFITRTRREFPARSDVLDHCEARYFFFFLLIFFHLFSYRFHIVPFFVLLLSVRVRFVSHATEMVDIQ